AGGADIRCAPYRTFGSPELSQAAVEALRDRRACLLANHGTVAIGATLAAALELSNEVESLARMYAMALQLGEPTVLPADEMARVQARFPAYRPPSA
ncbi:MAG: class II aldolase/adducin family protein, partial [Gammaproteobacteria bacterium]